MEHFLPMPIIFSWVTMLTEESNHWKPFVFCWPTRSSIQRTFSYCVAITSVQASIGYTDFMMNVSCIVMKLTHTSLPPLPPSPYLSVSVSISISSVSLSVSLSLSVSVCLSVSFSLFTHAHPLSLPSSFPL